MTDDANALRLVDVHGDTIRRVADMAAWWCWTGTVWRRDHDSAHIREHARTLARTLPESSTKTRTFKRNSLSSTGISGAVRVAESDPRISVRTADLDAHPLLLNTPAGIVDLRHHPAPRPPPHRHRLQPPPPGPRGRPLLLAPRPTHPLHHRRPRTPPRPRPRHPHPGHRRTRRPRLGRPRRHRRPRARPGRPGRVHAATEDYRISEDTLASFVRDTCLLGAGHWCDVPTLRARYERHAAEMGAEPLSAKALTMRLVAEYAVEQGRLSRPSWRIYRGIGLLTDDPDTDPGDGPQARDPPPCPHPSADDRACLALCER